MELLKYFNFRICSRQNGRRERRRWNGVAVDVQTEPASGAPRALYQRRTFADRQAGRPDAVDHGPRGGRGAGRGHRLVSAVRELVARTDGRARRQRRLHIRAVRGRRGRRTGRRGVERHAATARHDGGRHRAAELRTVHRHHGLVRSTGGHHAVRVTKN